MSYLWGCPRGEPGALRLSRAPHGRPARAAAHAAHHRDAQRDLSSERWTNEPVFRWTSQSDADLGLWETRDVEGRFEIDGGASCSRPQAPPRSSFARWRSIRRRRCECARSSAGAVASMPVPSPRSGPAVARHRRQPGPERIRRATGRGPGMDRAHAAARPAALRAHDVARAGRAGARGGADAAGHRHTQGESGPRPVGESRSHAGWRSSDASPAPRARRPRR